jgi:hypothetical protein
MKAWRLSYSLLQLGGLLSRIDVDKLQSNPKLINGYKKNKNISPMLYQHKKSPRTEEFLTVIDRL